MDTMDDKQRINETFARLVESSLREAHIDVFHSSIRFSVDSGPTEENHVIVFRDVADFFFTRGHGELRFHDVGRFELAPDFFTMGEWTSAQYHPNGIGLLRVAAAAGSLASQWVGQYRANPNFAVERSPGTFFIEAARVQIDDELFVVGFPPDRTSVTMIDPDRETAELSRRLEADLYAPTGFFVQLRQGNFQPDGLERLIALLTSIAPSQERAIDRKLVSLLWDLARFLRAAIPFRTIGRDAVARLEEGAATIELLIPRIILGTL